MTLRRARPFWAKKKEGGALSYIPFVDAYPSAWAVYSHKLENTSYLGPLIRVRNRSTLVETDVFPEPDGTISEAGLLALRSGSQLIDVVTKYDQTGNGFNLVKSSINGGLIVDSSGVIKDGAFIVSNDQDIRYTFSHGGSLNNASSKSAFSVIKTTTLTNALAIGTRGTTSTGWIFRYRLSNLIYAIISGSGSISSTVTFLINTRFILSFTHSGTTGKTFSNGVLSQSGSSSGGTNSATYYYGEDSTGGHSNQFHFHALFNSDQDSNAIAIQNLLNDYYSVY